MARVADARERACTRRPAAQQPARPLTLLRHEATGAREPSAHLTVLDPPRVAHGTSPALPVGVGRMREPPPSLGARDQIRPTALEPSEAEQLRVRVRALAEPAAAGGRSDEIRPAAVEAAELARRDEGDGGERVGLVAPPPRPLRKRVLPPPPERTGDAQGARPSPLVLCAHGGRAELVERVSEASAPATVVGGVACQPPRVCERRSHPQLAPPAAERRHETDAARVARADRIETCARSAPPLSDEDAHDAVVRVAYARRLVRAHDPSGRTPLHPPRDALTEQFVRAECGVVLCEPKERAGVGDAVRRLTPTE